MGVDVDVDVCSVSCIGRERGFPKVRKRHGRVVLVLDIGSEVRGGMFSKRKTDVRAGIIEGGGQKSRLILQCE